MARQVGLRQVGGRASIHAISNLWCAMTIELSSSPARALDAMSQAAVNHLVLILVKPRRDTPPKLRLRNDLFRTRRRLMKSIGAIVMLTEREVR